VSRSEVPHHYDLVPVVFNPKPKTALVIHAGASLSTSGGRRSPTFDKRLTAVRWGLHAQLAQTTKSVARMAEVHPIPDMPGSTRDEVGLLGGDVRLYEHPACQVPPPPFSNLSFFLSPFSCLTAPQAFSRPDRVLSQAGARRCCQGWPLFSGHPRGSAFTAIEHDGKLDGSGRLHSCLLFIRLKCQCALFRCRMFIVFGRSCYEVRWRVR
jgi:hypothetical protein